MRLSAVDPGIIRELSGIYKPFVKAFKELISNAYDADAKKIFVTLTNDFSAMEVLDDGLGMTPYEFQDSFARLGGSTAWLSGGTSPGGRPRIGYKGIGFLAVARYCGALQVETHSLRPYKGRRIITRRSRKTIPVEDIIGEPIPKELVTGKVKIRNAIAVSGRERVSLKLGRDYLLTAQGVRLVSARSVRGSQIEFGYEVDCSRLVLDAVLDFDYLLGLERKTDLRLLENFCTVALREPSRPLDSYTRIRLVKLKDFVIRDLSASPVRGKARNIVFKSGKEQFLWRLSRTTPIRDGIPRTLASGVLRQVAELQAQADLPDILVKWRAEEPVALTRSVYIPPERATPLEETVAPVDIDEGGLRVVGYLLARTEILYPAELRGLSIRIRHVAIGDASFLGWEHILTGPRKAALSQITGELLVLKGLDAADAINPGRESFYEENSHYRILKRALFGSEESIGGLVGKAVRDILDRSHIRSQVTGKLNDARERRKTLMDISSAVNFYTRDRGWTGRALNAFFGRPIRADGLASARSVPLRPGHKLAGFEVEEGKGLTGGNVEIDFKNRKVRFDFEQDAWNTTVYLHGHYYDVSIRQGRPDQPICEFDNERRRIYVNWGHPVKLHMDEAAFLKSAILLRLAHYVEPNDANMMMDLALNMLAFRAE